MLSDKLSKLNEAEKPLSSPRARIFLERYHHPVRIVLVFQLHKYGFRSRGREISRMKKGENSFLLDRTDRSPYLCNQSLIPSRASTWRNNVFSEDRDSFIFFLCDSFFPRAPFLPFLPFSVEIYRRATSSCRLSQITVKFPWDMNKWASFLAWLEKRETGYFSFCIISQRTANLYNYNFFRIFLHSSDRIQKSNAFALLMLCFSNRSIEKRVPNDLTTYKRISDKCSV